MALVFKIVAAEAWRAAAAAGVFLGAEVDRADGYIHFSTAAQAPETAAKWFAGRADLTLVAVEADAWGRLCAGSLRAAGRSFPIFTAPLPIPRSPGRARCRSGPTAARFSETFAC